MKSFVITALALFAGLMSSVSSFAAALVENMQGDVRAGATARAATAVRNGQRVEMGTVITTGAKSLVTLRFDDGQAVVLNENAEFRITNYSFVRDDPKKNAFLFDLFKGAMRAVTSIVNTRNAQAYALRTPQATIGIRGTDFMVALVNPAFLSVLSGAVGVSNAAGAVTFAAGTTATVASATALATTIAVTALPASVAASFSQLGSLAVTAGAGAGASGTSGAGGAGAGSSASGAVGASAATGAAAGGVTLGTIGIVGAAVAGVAAIASQKDPSQTTGTR